MKRRFGFTLIEISIFLAITGLLFVGIAIGASNSVAQQRFTDSVQNFAEFLKSVYSAVENPQSLGNGRSDKAIYGKLVTFGESKNLAGDNNSDNRVFVYDVIGNISGIIDGNDDTLKTLTNLGVNVVKKENNAWVLAGMADSYLPKWGAKIQQTANKNNIAAALLIVRHPSSGTIQTLVMDTKTININNSIKAGSNMSAVLTNPLKNKEFALKKQIDFCVNPNGDRRQDVRIVAGASGANGVEVVPLDSSDNLCVN